MATAGYSATPLAGKLGLKPGGTLVLLNAIDGIEDQLAPMPTATVIRRTLASSNQLVLLFCKDSATLQRSLPAVAKKLAAEGSLWISWPKKSSKLFIDLTEDGIRAIVLPIGLVDVKVCAVNADWSGLKLMVRKELRAGWNQ